MLLHYNAMALESVFFDFSLIENCHAYYLKRLAHLLELAELSTILMHRLLQEDVLVKIISAIRKSV